MQGNKCRDGGNYVAALGQVQIDLGRKWRRYLSDSAAERAWCVGPGLPGAASTLPGRKDSADKKERE